MRRLQDEGRTREEILGHLQADRDASYKAIADLLHALGIPDTKHPRMLALDEGKRTQALGLWKRHNTVFYAALNHTKTR